MTSAPSSSHRGPAKSPGLSPSADGLSQPFQQSFKVRHAFAEFTKLLLHRIKPGLQSIDPLIQPRLRPRHVLPRMFCRNPRLLVRISPAKVAPIARTAKPLGLTRLRKN